jgi:hypothetical protein
MKKLVLHSLPVLLLGCLGVTGVNADSTQDEAQPSPAIVDTGIKAGRVFRDPETGELGPPPATIPAEAGIPTARLSAATRQKLNRSSEGLQARTLPDGTRLIDLQGRFQNFSVATLDEHGEAHLNCSHSVDDIEQTLEEAPARTDEQVESAP